MECCWNDLRPFKLSCMRWAVLSVAADLVQTYNVYLHFVQSNILVKIPCFENPAVFSSTVLVFLVIYLYFTVYQLPSAGRFHDFSKTAGISNQLLQEQCTAKVSTSEKNCYNQLPLHKLLAELIALTGSRWKEFVNIRKG